MLEVIRGIATALAPRLVEIRRHIHGFPELSGQEWQTAAYVAGVLSSCGLTVREAVAKTGLLADLGTGDAPLVAVRADLDALPIQEATGLAYSSRIPGVMHACGHDVHTTVALGTAMVLSQLGVPLPGRVRFLFQPAEETAQGARWMVEAGALENVIALLGVHVWPALPGGTVGIRYGALTAAADELDITILGESGHGARPHEAIDAVWIAAQVISNLQQAISRTQNALRPMILTIGKIQGGRAANVIADQVQLFGTVRSLHPETRLQLPQWIEGIVQNTCATYHARYTLEYRTGVPGVQNDPGLTQLVEQSAHSAWGTERVQILAEPSLGAEDFSLYLEKVPGTMFRLGTGVAGQPYYSLHHPKFTVDEAAILTGVVTMASSVWNFWQQDFSHQNFSHQKMAQSS
ncbi:amidohydrolase subfamily [Gloeomargarita lithophora Alchichica-D10]|uniref:Amidohydrolase subfamily n=1 Tax=Gloeomargarita lithophora Alchichica-D10 TaxID=1188229 RepID=A0A1J0ABW2_9CYAN|nr:M20 family metallopeptidase [Gloeomargarita lithophora]APB33422.1 amidohydrolase subfamily [Gloeomargarita lithophora Alchichica-D10]